MAWRRIDVEPASELESSFRAINRELEEELLERLRDRLHEAREALLPTPD